MRHKGDEELQRLGTSLAVQMALEVLSAHLAAHPEKQIVETKGRRLMLWTPNRTKSKPRLVEKVDREMGLEP